MKDALGIIGDLRRPPLLVRAAKHGSREYDRNIHLNRVLGFGPLPRHGAALMQLVDIEAELNEQRLGDDAEYNVRRHVEVLSVIMGEACLMREALAN